MKSSHIKPIFDVRWRLEYHDGTAPKWGQWTRPEKDPAKMCSFQPRKGLARAFVEVRDKRTFQTFTPVHCKADDFVMFKWEYLASIAMCLNKPIQEQKVNPQVAGLKLVTRDLEALILVDGREPVIKKRIESDKEYNYACF